MRLEPARLHVFTDFDGTITRPDTLEFLSPRETFAALSSPAVLEVLFELPAAAIERQSALQADDQGLA